jgi:hypothetical protein
MASDLLCAERPSRASCRCVEGIRRYVVKRLTGSSPRLFKLCTHLVAIVGIVLASASTLSAQERLFGIFYDRLIELDATPGRPGRPLASIELGSADHLVAVAGGRFLAFTRGHFEGSFPIRYRLHLVDLLTGEIREVPVGTFTGPIVASDPRVPRLYIEDAESYTPTGGFAGYRVAVVDLAQMTTSYFPQAFELFKNVAVHPPSGPIFVTADSGFYGAHVTVLDPTTGATRTFRTATTVSNLVVTPDGSRVYVTGTGPTGNGISSYDLGTGALLASNIAPSSALDLETLALDPTRNRLVVSNRGNPRLVGVLNAGTLAVEAVVPLSIVAGVPAPPMQTFNAQFEYSARWDALYVAATNKFSPGSNQPGTHMCHTVLTRLDAASGDVSERSDVTALMGRDNLCANSLVVVRTPESPTVSGVTVGGAVTIEWTDPGNTLHFDVEAGTAPGLRDIAVIQGIVGTSVLVPEVLRGTYYVRVRAINAVGRSLPSNEVEIVVP